MRRASHFLNNWPSAAIRIRCRWARRIVIFAPFPLNLPRANRLPRSAAAAEAALSVDRFASCVYGGLVGGSNYPPTHSPVQPARDLQQRQRRLICASDNAFFLPSLTFASLVCNKCIARPEMDAAISQAVFFTPQSIFAAAPVCAKSLFGSLGWNSRYATSRART